MTKKEKWSITGLISLIVLMIVLIFAILLGEISLITCGALHLARGTFDISDGGAIAMIVIGALLMLSTGGSTAGSAVNIKNN